MTGGAVMMIGSDSGVRGDMLKIASYEILGKLPDPFLFDDGRRVASREDWTARRRELYGKVIELQYGVMPPENEFTEFETLYDSRTTKVFRIKAGPRSSPVTFRMKLILPDGVKEPPVIVDGDLCFNYAMDREWLNAALDSGIAWALFDRTELANDLAGENGRAKGQLFDAYKDLDCGALGAWAWGYSRVVDVLERLSITDNDCIAFTGHSRGGKTCALAGALDTRAAIVNPNETCAGACSCYRTHLCACYAGDEQDSHSETLKDLLHNFSFWMGPDLGKYADREEDLPFDCHELKAMIAPRTLFVSEAAGDIWANPVGSWQTTLAAKEVYSFLGAENELFWYFRPGKHFHKVGDVRMLVSLIKRRQSGGADFCADGFFKLPFDPGSVGRIFDWKAPEIKNLRQYGNI